MGYCYTHKAGRVLERFAAEHCTDGSSNVYSHRGGRYFFEVTRRDQPDGGIRGTIHRFVGNSRARKVGTFAIDGQGKVLRGPSIMKACEAPDPLRF